MQIFWLKVSDEFYESLENPTVAVTTSLRLLGALETAISEDMRSNTSEMLVQEATHNTFQRVSNYYLGNW